MSALLAHRGRRPDAIHGTACSKDTHFWRRDPTEQGHSGAQLMAGVALHMGFCVKQDRVAAMRLLTASAAQGNEGAEIYLQDVEKDLTPDERRTLEQERIAIRH